ncbi:MAG: transglycosylase domain-containing protein [Kineosporiaceae bacterium]
MPEGNATRSSTRSSTRSVVARLVVFVLASMLAGALSVVLFASPAIVAGTVVTAATGSFNDLPSILAALPLPQPSVLLSATGSRIASFYTEDRTVVPLAKIAPVERRAIVAIEDARFYEHGAVDPRGLARAALNDLTGGSTQGASTLTEQYVKNALLEQAELAGDATAAREAVAPTLARKLREMRLAIGLEQTLTKDQILERYLNIVYFGSGAYGIEAAAERYFRVHAAALSLPQAATLAGLVQQPAAFDPVTHPSAAKRRRDIVLKAMLDEKMISPPAYRRAIATKLVVIGTPLAQGCAGAGRDGFFCDDVVHTLVTDPEFATLGGTPQARLAAISRGGLVIRSTLDPATQAAADQAVDRRVPETDPSGLGAAAVTVEPGTGKVLAMAENRTYSVSGEPGRTSVNYATDTAAGGSSGFQTGSSFKPFTLATWLAQGHSLDDVVDATPRDFAFDQFTSCGTPLRGSQPYRPGNSEGTETGPMSVLRATADSVNVAYVAMESQLDLCDIANTAQSLGLHLAAPERECSLSGPPSQDLPTCIPSLTLGVKDIAPLTMAAAYAGFANGGVYCPPVTVTSITRATDDSPASGPGRQPVPVPAPACRQALTPQVASGVTQALSHVLTDGTAAAVGPLSPWPSAGKTGTTDGPYDSWFVGYTAQRSTAVWSATRGRAAHPGGS